VFLSRDPALTVSLLSTYDTATLLSRDGAEVKVSLAPLLGASTLVRYIVAECHLHPGIHGPLMIFFAVAADVLMSVRDILGTGESNLVEDNIEEVVQVLNSLGIEANLSQTGIINEYEYAAQSEEDMTLEIVFEPRSDEETVSEGDDNEVTDNLLNVAIVEEDIKKEIMIELARDEETDGNIINEAMSKSWKECYGDIAKVAMFYPDRNNIEEKLFKCKSCSYSCSSTSVLQIHIRKHTGKKPYTCIISSYSSTNLSNLRRHSRIHTGQKLCKLCHGRLHIRQKLLKCKFCSYS